MAEIPAVDLSFATTDELLDELENRCDAVLVAYLLKSKDGIVSRSYKASPIHLDGLLAHLKRFVREAIKRRESAAGE